MSTGWQTRPLRSPLALCALAAGAVLCAPVTRANARRTGCEATMRAVEGFCIDAYEASLLDIDANGATRPHPYYLPVDGARVRAVARKGAYPQGYISRNEADVACRASGKRLCKDDEWLAACRGPSKQPFPYGPERREGACNDAGVSPLNHFFGGAKSGADPYTWASMNDPRLNQLAGGLAQSGSKPRCRSAYGAYDLVGNLHEWTADPAGTFRGGYFLDTKINGEGCDYRTTAHNATYHDYSTGFRCCADLP